MIRKEEVSSRSKREARERALGRQSTDQSMYLETKNNGQPKVRWGEGTEKHGE